MNHARHFTCCRIRAVGLSFLSCFSLPQIAILSGCASHTNTIADIVLAKPRSGFIPVEGGKVWYEIHGTGHGTPLLVLHGGPGVPHDYLENLDQLGGDRPVIFYDQLGCGKSDRPDDKNLWTRERFARELEQVRLALGLNEVVLYGHSWGTILAVDSMAGLAGTTPKGVKGVILAGPALNIHRWMEDARQLLATLGPGVVKSVLEAERAGTTDTPAYQDAVQKYYARYLCRKDAWPEPLTRAMANIGQGVYEYMCGPSEFTATGTLKDLDVTPELRTLNVPTLFICGEFDEARPDTTRAYSKLVPSASIVVIPGAAHIANFDQPEAYMASLRQWFSINGL